MRRALNSARGAIANIVLLIALARAVNGVQHLSLLPPDSLRPTPPTIDSTLPNRASSHPLFHPFLLIFNLKYTLRSINRRRHLSRRLPSFRRLVSSLQAISPSRPDQHPSRSTIRHRSPLFRPPPHPVYSSHSNNLLISQPRLFPTSQSPPDSLLPHLHTPGTLLSLLTANTNNSLTLHLIPPSPRPPLPSRDRRRRSLNRRTRFERLVEGV